MKKHSPGPWTALSTGRGVLIDSVPAMIARIPFTGEQAESDGRLIAAAPDMLLMLRKMFAIETNPYVASELIALIEKAEGKS